MENKVLSLEDIISLGWVVNCYLEYYIMFDIGDWSLSWNTKSGHIEISLEEYDLGYCGNCPSKNKLKLIMNLLKIK